MTDHSPDEYLKMAWKALLRGDTAERDRLCGLSLKAHDELERLKTLTQNDSMGKH